MTNDLYQQAKKVFLEICDLDSGIQAERLDSACGDDPSLRAEIQSLLNHHDPRTALTMGDEPASGAEDGGEHQARRRIGPYRILHEIDRGGMGVVYLGVREDDRFKQRAAIKVVKRGMDTVEVLKRFDLERQLLAALNHANIARLYDGGETEDGLPYFALEYVEGQPIHEYCDSRRLRIAERLELFRQVCSAVHYAHQNLIVHRDLKPGNILVTKEGVPKLLDFGIAKILNPEFSLVAGDPTAPELRIMTPEYASPEQVQGAPISTASDVYSLGVLLYELMTGHRPYRLRSRVRAEIERAICEDDPDKPSTSVSRVEEFTVRGKDPTTGSTRTITPESVSKVREGKPDRLRRRLAGDIDNIVLMAMRKEPQRRYKSAEDLSEDIRRHLEGLPVAARGDSTAYRFSKFVLRNRVGAGAAVLVAASLVGGTAVAWSQADKAIEQEKIAEDARDVAIAQEQAAQEQREQAELYAQLVENYIGTFHREIAKLSGVGPAREALADSTLNTLKAVQDQHDNTPKSQRLLAMAHDLMGDVYGGIRNPSTGELDKALEQYQASFELRAALSDASPGDQSRLHDLAVGHEKIGDIHAQLGQTDQSLNRYREALAIRERVWLVNPDSKWRRVLAVALVDYGAALVAAGRNDEARTLYDRALVIRRDLLVDDDSELNMRRTSVALNRVGASLRRDGEYDMAIKYYNESAEIRRGLLAMAPDTARARRDLMLQDFFVAQAHLGAGRPKQALTPARAYVAEAEALAEENPGVFRHARDMVIGYEPVGLALLRTDRLAEAATEFQKLQRSATAALESWPTNATLNAALTNSHIYLGQTAMKAGNAGEAVTHFRAALESSRTPFALREFAAALHADGDLDQAIEIVNEALALLADEEETDDVRELRQGLEADLARYQGG